MLGIIIGVAAVILLVAIGNGVQASVNARIQPLANLITITPTTGNIPGGTAPKDLIDGDVEALRRDVVNAAAVIPAVTGQTLAETDTNKDGVVDHLEFQMRIEEVFFSADRNKDGFLDAEELKQLAFPDDFTDDDKDRDGRVSMREFLRVRFHDYDVADTNHDGVLSLDEVVAAFEGRKRR